MELNEVALEAAAEAAHYAQGLDDYGVANEEEIGEATDLAREIVSAYLAALL